MDNRRLPVTRCSIAIGWVILITLSGSATFAQSPSPSGSSTPATTPFDGHYSGDSTSVPECRPGTFDVTVKAGAITGSFGFPSVSNRSPHDFTWTASGTVDAGGTVTAVFKTDDGMVSKGGRTFEVTGTVRADRLDVTEVGGTCRYAASLRKSK